MLVFSLVLGAGAYGVSRVQAQNQAGLDRFNSLVDKLVSKFNLNKEEVEQVFEEERQARWQEMEQKRNEIVGEKLDQAVKNGELSNEQKQLITNKLAELEKEREANREAHQNLSEEERAQTMKNHREELEKWASDNKIDLKYLFLGGLGRKMGGERMGGGFGQGRGMER